MSLDIYSLAALRGVVSRVKIPPQFLLNTFFGNVIDADGEKIVFDVLEESRRVTPFVSPLLPGKVVDSQGYYAAEFTPAYVKDYRPLNPARPLKRRAGETLTGGPAVTPMMREAAILAEELTDMNRMYVRRLELMAVDALLDGIVTVEGDGFPSVAVNFGRASGNTLSLSGTGSAWGQAGVSPVADVENWNDIVLQASGLSVTDIVFTPDVAWQEFRADPLFKDAINTFLRGTQSEAEIINIQKMEGATLKGRLGDTGPLLWTYQGWYKDPTVGVNSETTMLPANTVLLGSRDARAQGFRAFGAIRDPDIGYGAAREAGMQAAEGDLIQENFFVKSWTTKNPGQRHLLGQGAPLVGLSRPNATMAVTVA